MFTWRVLWSARSSINKCRGCLPPVEESINGIQQELVHKRHSLWTKKTSSLLQWAMMVIHPKSPANFRNECRRYIQDWYHHLLPHRWNTKTVESCQGKVPYGCSWWKNARLVSYSPNSKLLYYTIQKSPQLEVIETYNLQTNEIVNKTNVFLPSPNFCLW